MFTKTVQDRVVWETVYYRCTSKLRRMLVSNKIVLGKAYRRCSNYTSSLDLTHRHGFNGLGKDNCKRSRRALEFYAAYIRGLTVHLINFSIAYVNV